MNDAGRRMMIGAAALALVAGAATGGTQLTIALERRGDPSPRQVAVGIRTAGVVLGLAVSWSRSAMPTER